MLPAHALRISNANHAVFAKLSYEPRQGRDDKVFIETMSQKLLFFGSIQHQTLPLACSQRLSDSEIMVASPCEGSRVCVCVCELLDTKTCTTSPRPRNLTDFCGRLLATTEPVTQQASCLNPIGFDLRISMTF